MTVKELAAYLKLSEMMIYKLAQRGEIPSAKVGSAWRFSQDEIDRWLVQKTQTTRQVAGPAADALDDFLREVRTKFGKDFVSAVLFGSCARGEASEGSDIDILIVLKDGVDLPTSTSRLVDIAYATTFGKGRGILLSPVAVNESRYLTGMSPLLLNIRREGVKAA